jgi:hypothetical protein
LLSLQESSTQPLIRTDTNERNGTKRNEQITVQSAKRLTHNSVEITHYCTARKRRNSAKGMSTPCHAVYIDIVGWIDSEKETKKDAYATSGSYMQ